MSEGPGVAPSGVLPIPILMQIESTPSALEALTDMVLFIGVYAAVLTTVYAIGEPKTRSEAMGRAIALWLCGIAAVVLIVWLVVAIILRVALLFAHG
jgi:hypothetical protein